MSRLLKLILGFALIGQAVMAQPAAPPPTGAPAPETAPPASDADIPVRQRSTLGPQEMLAQAAQYRTRVEEILKQVQALVEKAKEEKDIIRLNCLTDKVVQLKANLVVVDNALRDLREAIARRDEGASVHEYTRITIIRQKASVLGAEGQACVGEDLAYVGATQVEVDESGVPPGDFTNPGEPTVTVDRPPLATPSS